MSDWPRSVSEELAYLEGLAHGGTVKKTQVEISVPSYANLVACERCGAKEAMLPERIEFTRHLKQPQWVVTGHSLPIGWSRLNVSDRDNPISSGGSLTHCGPCRTALDEALGERWKQSLWKDRPVPE